MQIFIRKLFIIVLILTCFGAIQAAEQSVILGNKWTIGILDHAPVILSDFTQGRAYIQLQSNNQFSGYTGCNKINGTFVLTPPNGLSFSFDTSGINQNSSCPEHLIKFEKDFITMLQNVQFWKITGDETLKALNLQNNPENISAIFAIMTEHG